MEEYIHSEFGEQAQVKQLSDAEIKRTFNEISHTLYREHQHIYTDGSVSSQTGRTSAALFVKDRGLAQTWRLPTEIEITNAELFAILEGCLYARESLHPKIVIFTDAKAALQLLLSIKPASYGEMVHLVLTQLKELIRTKQSFHLQWIPSHRGINGNEVADSAAKMALNMTDITRLKIPESSLKRSIKKASWDQWRLETSNLFRQSTTHLKTIRNDIEQHPWSRSKARILDSALFRLKTGHCGLYSHLHGINLVESARCEWCHQDDTVTHLIHHCPRHYSSREELKDKLRGLGVAFTTQRPKPSRRGKLHTGRSIHNTATAEDLPPEDRGSTKTVTEATQD